MNWLKVSFWSKRTHRLGQETLIQVCDEVHGWNENPDGQF